MVAAYNGFSLCSTISAVNEFLIRSGETRLLIAHSADTLLLITMTVVYMTVAIIIVTYNSQKHILQCLASLKLQRRQADTIIIIDNNSSDNTVALIEQNFPEVKIIKEGENHGYAKGNNIGIAEAKGFDLVALVNPDAFPEPEWLEAIEEAATLNPDYSSFASLIYIDGTNRLDSTGDIYHNSGIAWRRYYYFQKEKVELVQEPVLMPSGAAAVYYREAVLESGGFDEDYFCYFEDVDLGLKLQLKGHKCLFVPDAVVHHIGSASTGVESNFAIYHGYRNMDWTYMKCMPWPTVIRFLPAHLFMNLMVVLKYIKRGKPWTIVKAKLHSFAGILKAVKKRRKIQNTSKENKKRFVQLLNRENFIDVMRGRNIPEEEQ